MELISKYVGAKVNTVLFENIKKSKSYVSENSILITLAAYPT